MWLSLWGGLGSGMICLMGTGGFTHISLRHHHAMPGEDAMFAAIHIKGETSITRVLEGPIPKREIFGHPLNGSGRLRGTLKGGFGFPRFRNAKFKARFPFGMVELEDADIPLTIALTGWSPFIPGDADASSLPLAVVDYALRNPGKEKVEGVFSFHCWHPVAMGSTGSAIVPLEKGLIFSQKAMNVEKPWEEGYFAAVVPYAPCVTTDAGWFRGGWFDSSTMLWRSIMSGKLMHRPPHQDADGCGEGGSLYVPFSVPPGETQHLRILLTWFVPYSDLQVPRKAHGNGCCPASETYRPWYAERFESIHKLLAYEIQNVDMLDRTTRLFTDAFYDTTLPSEIVEAVAANLSILKSPTLLRQWDGRLYMWEGCADNAGCCCGSCTHVWNYAQALAHLFPTLERGLRETELLINQDASGHQNFRGTLPIEEPTHTGHAAADGQLGGIIKVYREWRISGDTDWLRHLWPCVRKSLDYCIALWDPDGKGMLVEPHHNTYDIELWGAESFCSSFYLGALSATVKMGRALNEEVSRYETLLEKGRKAIEKELFNGEYFYQKIQWEGLRSPDPVKMGKSATAVIKIDYSPEAKMILQEEGPKYQYGTGCLSDGVLGEWLIGQAGLPPVLDPEKVRSHLIAVYRYNLRRDLSAHPNPQRPGYALGDEGGLLLCTWPRGREPQLPFVYSNEVWTGIEYQVAAHLIRMGHIEEGLEIVRICRCRYDGRVRNPFDEYECGHFYGRALASYGLLEAFTRVRYDAVEKILYFHTFSPCDFQAFLATVHGFGTVGMRNGKPFLNVRYGEIPVAEIRRE